MKNKNRKNLYVAAGLLTAFVGWTVCVRFVDVRAIGPQGSLVGLASLNQFVHSLTGVRLSLYTITDWLGLVPIAVALGFASLGLVQWIKRKHIKRVDSDLFVLGGLYIVLAGMYLLFESVVINYRPTLINGYLEVSYPSSTTLLVLCVMPTAGMQLQKRIQNNLLKRFVLFAVAVFTILMVLGRLLSGVHWVTDIVGGALLSSGLVSLYRFISTCPKHTDI